MPPRTDLEKEADRLFLAGLATQVPANTSTAQLRVALNARRAEIATARALTESAGKPEVETAAAVDAAVAASQLSWETVSRDLSVVLARVRAATNATAAAFLDAQMDEVQEEIARTFLLDEEIMADLVRSREIESTRTAQRIKANGQLAVRPLAVTTFRQRGPGGAALIARLQHNFLIRQSLRSELGRLRFGRATWQTIAQSDAAASLAAQVMQLADPDPEVARQAAFELYTGELQKLVEASSEIVPADLANVQRARLGGMAGVVRMLREYVRRPDSEDEGKARTYELVFYQVDDDGTAVAAGESA